jgi:uncharacterized protein (TIGR03435 family)
VSNHPLALILEFAYFARIKNGSRITGGPDWVYHERLNIEAKAEDGRISPTASATELETALQSMLRGLFADRMKLSTHIETKEMPVFELTVSKKGPKLRQPAPRDCNDAMANCHSAVVGLRMGVQGHEASMADLADGLSRFMGINVLDKTGISGDFDFDVPPGFRRQSANLTADGENVSEPGVHVDSSNPDILIAIQILGLELKPSKARVDVLVIDHIERPTNEGEVRAERLPEPAKIISKPIPARPPAVVRQTPKFEVVSIRPTNPDAGSGMRGGFAGGGGCKGGVPT